MNENTINLIRELATKLGTTSEYLVKVFVAKVQADARVSLLILSVFFVGVTTGAVFLHRLIAREDENPVLIWIIWFFIAAFSCAVVSGNLPKLISPEAYAIKEILSSVARP